MKENETICVCGKEAERLKSRPTCTCCNSLGNVFQEDGSTTAQRLRWTIVEVRAGVTTFTSRLARLRNLRPGQWRRVGGRGAVVPGRRAKGGANSVTKKVFLKLFHNINENWGKYCLKRVDK